MSENVVKAVSETASSTAGTESASFEHGTAEAAPLDESDLGAASAQTEDSAPTEIPRIPELFRGKSVFITGARGFVGKVLLLKLLKCCPGIRQVFVLLRPRGLKDGETMLADLFSKQVLEEVRAQSVKVCALSGDLSHPDLGLPDRQLSPLLMETAFVFHCAANVRFDEKPRQCLSDNLLAVKHVLDLCHRMKNLEAVVHVSTAYSFCDRKEIDEEVYADTADPVHVLDCLRWMSDEQLEALCALLVRGRPSLYHVSKALAERLVAAQSPPLPAIIVRPSIVTAAWKEPLPGWIDNYNGPTGFLALCGKGVVRSVLVQPEVTADWVPVDVVANTIVAAAAMRRQLSGSVPVVHCTVHSARALSWGEVETLCFPLLLRFPSRTLFRCPGGSFTSSRARHALVVFGAHLLPAALADLVGLMVGHRPTMLSMYGRIHGVMRHLEYFTNHQFIFRSRNMGRLVHCMRPQDREAFPIDLRELDWKDYLQSYVLGVRRYFLKERDETLPEARRKMIRLYYLWLGAYVLPFVGLLLVVGRRCRSVFFIESYLRWMRKHPMTSCAKSLFTSVCSGLC